MSVHGHPQMVWKTWRVWFVHYTERIGGKLATFTIVNWNTSVAKAKVPCCPAAISVVSPKHFQTLCLSSGAGTEKKIQWQSASETASNVAEAELADQISDLSQILLVVRWM